MKQDQKNNEWSNRDIGALWKREGKNQKYLSGYVKVDELGIERELKVVVFSNKNKKDNDRAPDYRIYVSKPIENKSNDVSNKTSAKIVATPKQTTKKQDIAEEAEELL
ncbi:hypothetical protein EBU71_18330 [bacterium]|nr:hypothetical protein [Candidatus Elulimicrobium humile]